MAQSDSRARKAERRRGHPYPQNTDIGTVGSRLSSLGREARERGEHRFSSFGVIDWSARADTAKGWVGHECGSLVRAEVSDDATAAALSSWAK